jgi:Lysyl oxidase/Bacterial Ig domain
MLIRYFHRPIVWVALVLAVVPGTVVLGAIGQAHASGELEGLLLPNLVADPPDNVSEETSTTDGGLSEPGEARLLLRFNGYVHNDGTGALDVQGERGAPTTSMTAAAEVKRREKELIESNEEEARGEEGKEPQAFSETTERELALPSMNVSQRLFTTNEGIPKSNPEESKEAFEKFSKENEEYINARPHKDLASSAEMFYVNADGHHHWHLQHVAKYSLWNATKTAEVAPAEKVGFCLEDSEHVEREKENKNGEHEPTPKEPVYADGSAPYRDFCQRYLPYATGVYEGISPGWRDAYTSNLGFQWVDISNVLPGEYWLREEVNPDKVIKEEDLGSKVAYAEESTIVPGFDALPQALSTGFDEPVTITPASTRWEHRGEPDGALGEPDYTIVSPPQHGKLEPIGGTGQEIYTPAEGYSGPDSFTFSASDPNSEFPRSPAIATVSIEVGAARAPSVAISGAPSAMLVGTSVQLSALVANDGPGVTWSASAGSITPGGLYTAPSEPPAGGVAVIAARSARGATASVAIAIQPAPPATSLPAAESATPPKSSPAAHPPAIDRPQAMLIGRKLIMTTRASKTGRIRLSAYLGHRLLGTCAARTPAGRSFTCQVTLGRRIRLNARITVVASLRIGGKVVQSLRPRAPVPEMKMEMNGAHKPLTLLLGNNRKLSSLQLICGPAMM